MAAPPDSKEGQPTVRPPLFNEKDYGWQNQRMHDFLEGEDLKIWDIIEKGPKLPMLNDDKGVPIGPKPRGKYSDEHVKRVKKNAKSKRSWCVKLDQMNTIESQHAKMQGLYGMLCNVNMKAHLKLNSHKLIC